MKNELYNETVKQFALSLENMARESDADAAEARKRHDYEAAERIDRAAESLRAAGTLLSHRCFR